MLLSELVVHIGLEFVLLPQPPTSASQGTGIVGIGHHAQL